MAAFAVRRLETVSDADIEGLADVLVDVVEGGASVSFMHPFPREKAIAFWRGIADGVAAGERVLVVAEDEQGICGTAQLIVAQPENQPHRADLAKMLVHRRARRRGIGAAVLNAAEDVARELGKTLLVLDTASHDAERLYERNGWIRVGVIPDYALMPDGASCDTVVYYRRLPKAVR
jgi:GNAT superfamily N-acetyltransferase